MTYAIGSDGLPAIYKVDIARLDYSFDFKKWLQGVGDTIAAYAVESETTGEGGVTVEAPSHSAGVVTAFISGGTAGTDYKITCTITTTAGRIDSRTIKLLIKAAR